MIIIRNNIIPFKGFVAINLFGILFVRGKEELTAQTINHEKIHTRQIWEMLGILFYVWYVVEWLVRCIRRETNPYRNISFEKEAYENEKNFQYLKKRKLFSWLNYL